MNRIKNRIKQIDKRAAGRYLKWVAGVLACAVLAGCDNVDKAIPIELGTPVEMQEDYAEGETAGASPEEIAEPMEVCVYVCGAVKCPGMVTLPEGSRYNDALEAVGGFAEDAAREAVNLAQLLSDGEQIFFPTQEQAQAMSEALQSEQSGLVNINTADISKLCELPGIGKAKAQAIVAYREQNGAFGKAEDIMNVPGIKESAYSQMKDLITAQ